MEDNLKLPAYPLPIALHNNGTLNTTLDVDTASVGFTKLEKAALMIAQGLASNSTIDANNFHWRTIAIQSVDIARMVIEEANK